MKIRVHINDFTHSGYENVHISKIDSVFQNYDTGEVDKIWLDDVIDYVPVQDAENFIRKTVSLLKRGGSIIVSGIDLYEVCKSMSNYNISVAEANKLLYAGENGLVKKLCFTTPAAANVVESLGLKILTKRISDYKYTIEAIR